jgi:hypothetical protein
LSPQTGPAGDAPEPTSAAGRPDTNSPNTTIASSKTPIAVSSHASIVAGLSQNDEVLTVVVEKEVTLHQLSLQYIGRFDEIVLGEIYTLNPSVHDASHIEIGQRLRLPLYLRKNFKNLPLATVRSASLESQKDAQ